MRGRSYAPRGKTSVAVAVDGGRQKLSMICTVTNQGLANWMIIDGSFNHERLIEFFEALISGLKLGKMIFLILDNLGVHNCKPVKAWLAEHLADIEVFYLSGYSPELNAGERLNADLKHAIGTQVPVRMKTTLRAAAEQHLPLVRAKPQRVRACFQDPVVRYAA